VGSILCMDKQNNKGLPKKQQDIEKKLSLTMRDLTKVMNELFIIKNDLGRL